MPDANGRFPVTVRTMIALVVLGVGTVLPYSGVPSLSAAVLAVGADPSTTDQKVLRAGAAESGPSPAGERTKATRLPPSATNAVASAQGIPPEFTHAVVTVLTKDDRGDVLRMPEALFFDRKTDELYLLNGGDNRIIVYGPDYFPQESLGKGRGLDAPTGGYIDDHSNLYIPQAGTPSSPPRITILNSAFLPVKEFSLAKIPDLGTFIPQKIALGRDGTIYLVGLESARVLLLGPDGAFVKWFVLGIDKNGDYADGDGRRPEKNALVRSVAVDALGNVLFLSEETSKVYVFDEREHFLFAFGIKGGAEGKMSRPRALAIDEQKKCIYVVDYMRHTVLIFDFAGAFRFEFGGRGWGAEWFNYPVDIVLGRQGQVVVADFFNQRAQVFDIGLPSFPDRPVELWQAKAAPDGHGKSRLPTSTITPQ